MYLAPSDVPQGSNVSSVVEGMLTMRQDFDSDRPHNTKTPVCCHPPAQSPFSIFGRQGSEDSHRNVIMGLNFELTMNLLSTVRLAHEERSEPQKYVIGRKSISFQRNVWLGTKMRKDGERRPKGSKEGDEKTKGVKENKTAENKDKEEKKRDEKLVQADNASVGERKSKDKDKRDEDEKRTNNGGVDVKDNADKEEKKSETETKKGEDLTGDIASNPLRTSSNKIDNTPRSTEGLSQSKEVDEMAKVSSAITIKDIIDALSIVVTSSKVIKPGLGVQLMDISQMVVEKPKELEKLDSELSFEFDPRGRRTHCNRNSHAATILLHRRKPPAGIPAELRGTGDKEKNLNSPERMD
ncbi:unnamed protein product [Callosobruchus maculatus]|uniref:Uncharacterized protein n=1 Tax=Callosobruchus maculatus TaxID=64391 RepID=A0A653C2M3_CALMS|nr:unnamed protein product [Callosobruchus maculatus]